MTFFDARAPRPVAGKAIPEIMRDPRTKTPWLLGLRLSCWLRHRPGRRGDVDGCGKTPSAAFG